MSLVRRGVGGWRYGFPWRTAAASTGTAVQPWRATVEGSGVAIVLFVLGEKGERGKGIGGGGWLGVGGGGVVDDDGELT